LKRVFPQESAADSHSLNSNGIQPGALGGSRRVQTSAAMLGIALSFGTSAPVLFESESALAAEGPVVAVLPTAGSKAEIAQPVIVSQPSDVASTAYHTVENGDSLWHIAKEHHVDVHSIKAANGIEPDEVLRVGQVLRVPSVLEGVPGAEGADQVQRLALSGNVRGGVGGDLSVVFGEELPSIASDDQELDSEETVSLASLDDEALEKDASEKPRPDQSYEMTAAALGDGLESAAPVPTLAAVAPEEVVEMPVSALPDSLPLNAVEANPLAARATIAAAPAAVVSEDSLVSQPAIEEVSQPAIEESAAAQPESESSGQPVAAADGWQSRNIQATPEANSSQRTVKPLTVAALGNVADDEVDNAPEAVAPVADTQAYRVKAGDTFWNIANRHGLSIDELMRHNAGRNPESLFVGESINVPVSAEQVSQDVSASTLARASDLQSETNRDVAIRDHLARIREAANREIDQEELKARIIAVRQSLEQAEAESIGSAPLEFHSASESSEAPQAEYGAQGLASPESQSSRLSTTGTSAPAQADWTVTDAASEGDGTRLAALTTRTEASDAVSEVPSVPAVPANLMAAAPMSPEVYRASPQMPIGETVTPGMPILPDSGEYLPEAPNRFNGYVWPAQGVLTSGYGWRWGRMHRGIDIAGPVGTPIMAAASGVVVRSGWNSGGYGNLVDIRHADGSMTRYAHNSRLLVREGQQVRQGQQIAEMGSTGFSTGPHVHFEVHLPNTGTVNPMAYLPGR
jgi:murein DD-endopeptidase MepM/ murein hydrolase activator NlpD